MPLLTSAVPEDLVDNNYFAMEVAEVLKWSFLICSLPVAFNRVLAGLMTPGCIAPRHMTPGRMLLAGHITLGDKSAG